MNFKKMLVILLACAMTIAIISGCSNSTAPSASSNSTAPSASSNSTAPSASGDSSQVEQEAAPKNTVINIDDLKIEVLSCSFDKEVMGIDEEFSGYGFTERDGKVYVNLALKITNNRATPLKKDEIKGYFEYDELRYDLQYELMSSVPVGSNDNLLAPDCIGFVNMISLVDEEATKENLTVHFTIDENEYSEKVMPIDTRSAFEKKTEVSVGDTFDANGLYEVEVIKCEESKYLRATNYNESRQYQSANEKFIDLVLNIKNNTNVNFRSIYGYVIIDEDGIRAIDKVEVKENTELESMDIAPIKPGEEGIVHLYVTVEDDMDTDDLAMRFNLGGNCYYCYVE
ncbi:MAG: hypothetical protein E7473_12080 [Ruminococcaceae bacterium]|nr:hypothetical protein [Oscillospiraceae bacterium]